VRAASSDGCAVKAVESDVNRKCKGCWQGTGGSAIEPGHPVRGGLHGICNLILVKSLVGNGPFGDEIGKHRSTTSGSPPDREKN